MLVPNNDRFLNEIKKSSDASWLIEQLRDAMKLSVTHVVRMAAIVARLEQLGVTVELELSILPYLKRIAHGNLSAELFVACEGHKKLLDKASTLPTNEQERIARNESYKVMASGGKERMVPAMSMTNKEIDQVFAFGRIRTDAEQVGIIQERETKRALSYTVPDDVRPTIDRKRKGVVVGSIFISLPELEAFVNALKRRRKK